MGNGTRVRSPLVEGLLVLGQQALTNTVRDLTIVEEMLLRKIFQGSVDYDKIQIAKAVNVNVITLDEAPQGYKDFDKGAAKKYVIDPHGVAKKAAA